MPDRFSVLLIGAGGLGSPVALALAESPRIGQLTLLDPDRVELSNLHRQILLQSTDLGRLKVDAAADTLRARRSRAASGELRIVTHAARLTAENADALIAEHQLVIEGSDDLATKFLVSDAALACGVPALIGGVVRWSGQLTTTWPASATSATSSPTSSASGCYRCLFEEPPPEGTAVTCQQAGVLGPACGLIGGLMAAEALAALAGTPRYAGSLLTVDLLAWRLRKVPIPRRSSCPAHDLRRGRFLDSAGPRS